jgi:uncharacterized protein YecE (DUF72 family)
MAASNPQIDWYIGTIRFGYDGRRDAFYPHGMNSSSYLTHYSLIFNAVEIDSTFRAVPRSGRKLATLEYFFAFLPSNLTYTVEVRHQTWYTANPGEAEPAPTSSLRRYGIC